MGEGEIFYGAKITWVQEKKVPQLIHSFNKCLLNIFCVIGTEGNKKMNQAIHSKSLFEETHT